MKFVSLSTYLKSRKYSWKQQQTSVERPEGNVAGKEMET